MSIPADELIEYPPGIVPEVVDIPDQVDAGDDPVDTEPQPEEVQ